MAITRLEFDKGCKTEYCIPLWLRDEQVKLAIQRVRGRIQSHENKRTDPLAVVGFGPSLKDTWEQVRGFQHVISCSGSHKLLIEKAIVPTWHVEVDPRPHKVALLGPPHPDVEYLVASACHPEYFKHLDGFNVKLWHVFSTEAEAMRMLPANEWAITGGCDVGLRALTIARFLGFTELHVFGIDGSSPNPEGARHAAYHPNPCTAGSITEYEGREFYTTPAMLEAAKQVWHELDMMPDVTATFYGDGLVQHMSKFYQRKATANTNIAYNKPELISAEYRGLNAQLHRENPTYGVTALKHVDTVVKLMETTKSRSVLDYGCGKGLLGKGLAEKGIPIWEYDPCIPGKEESPRPSDLVVCIDVLEHIEPDKLVFVLDDLRRCVRKVGFFTIHTGAAAKHLPDGRNTHLIQQGRKWWQKRLAKFFTIGQIWEVGAELYVLVGPKVIRQSVVAEKPLLQEAMA